LAVDATARPAVFALSTVVSLAAPPVPLAVDDFGLLRPEDAFERPVLRDELPFCERRVPERDFAAGRLADELRALDRLAFEL
jgi:hypothetical protein